jgi:hypothetical protein
MHRCIGERVECAQLRCPARVRDHGDTGTCRIEPGRRDAQQIIEADREYACAEFASLLGRASEQRLVKMLLRLTGR